MHGEPFGSASVLRFDTVCIAKERRRRFPRGAAVPVMSGANGDIQGLALLDSPALVRGGMSVFRTRFALDRGLGAIELVSNMQRGNGTDRPLVFSVT